jgi:hypothetical protein
MSKETPTTKTLRVTFIDASKWEAFFPGTDRDDAIKRAQACWANGGTDGFDPEHRLDVCDDGIDWQADEVPANTQGLLGPEETMPRVLESFNGEDLQDKMDRFADPS